MVPDKDIPEKLDNSYLEYAIVKLFSIDVLQLIKVKASLSKQFRLQPSEIDRMAFWEYEYYLKIMNDLVKEENDQQEREMDKYNVREHMNAAKPGNMSKMLRQSQPKMPTFGSIKMPG